MYLFLRILLICFFTCLNHQAYGFEEEKCRLTITKNCADYGERIIDAVATTQCWRYEEQFHCIGKEKNKCLDLEANRGCQVVNDRCLEESNLGLCQKTEKRFSCSKDLNHLAEVQHVDTQFTIMKDEKDLSQCTKEDIDQYCEVVDEVCVESKQLRNINGKMVEKDCWKWEKKYACQSNNIIDECKDLDQNCRLTGEKECLHHIKVEAQDICVHFENKYVCTDKQVSKKPCIATKFCIGDICKKKARFQHKDFGDSVSKLAILNSMKSDQLDGCKCPNGKQSCEANEIDPADCKLFSGQAKQCHKSTSQHNCCSEKGFIRNLVGCQQSEKDLFELKKQGLCHHVGSWKGKSLEDKIKFTSYQSYCCFKSKIAKIIHVGGKAQLGISWGDIKNPDCRPLTLAEIRKIDFSQIKFDEMFADIESNVQSKISANKNALESKMNMISGNPESTSEAINKKISKFYGDVK